MYFLILCAAFVGIVVASPIPDDINSNPEEKGLTNKDIRPIPRVTPQRIEKLCQLLHSKGVEQGLFPTWAYDKSCNFDDTTKQQISDLANDFHDGKIAHKPENVEELIALLKEKTPAAGTAAQEINDQFREKLRKLPQHLQDLQKKWEALGYEGAHQDHATWFTNSIKNAKTFFNDMQSLTPDDFAAINTEFPEFIKAYNDPRVEPFRNMFLNMNVDELTDKTKLKEIFKNTVENVESSINGTATL